jgi:hypothetical protein
VVLLRRIPPDAPVLGGFDDNFATNSDPASTRSPNNRAEVPTLNELKLASMKGVGLTVGRSRGEPFDPVLPEYCCTDNLLAAAEC